MPPASASEAARPRLWTEGPFLHRPHPAGTHRPVASTVHAGGRYPQPTPSQTAGSSRRPGLTPHLPQEEARELSSLFHALDFPSPSRKEFGEPCRAARWVITLPSVYTHIIPSGSHCLPGAPGDSATSQALGALILQRDCLQLAADIWRQMKPFT